MAELLDEDGIAAAPAAAAPARIGIYCGTVRCSVMIICDDAQLTLL